MKSIDCFFFLFSYNRWLSLLISLNYCCGLMAYYINFVKSCKIALSQMNNYLLTHNVEFFGHLQMLLLLFPLFPGWKLNLLYNSCYLNSLIELLQSKSVGPLLNCRLIYLFLLFLLLFSCSCCLLMFLSVRPI